jgi:hypothetical protein
MTTPIPTPAIEAAHRILDDKACSDCFDSAPCGKHYALIERALEAAWPHLDGVVTAEPEIGATVYDFEGDAWVRAKNGAWSIDGYPKAGTPWSYLVDTYGPLRSTPCGYRR